jgi:hypothetical protein
MRLDWRNLAKSSQTCTSLRCTGLSSVHRTVFGAQAGARDELAALGKSWGAAAIIHWIVQCAPDCPVSQLRPRQRRQRNQWATRGLRQWSPGRTRLFSVPPDCPVCQGYRGCNGRLRQKRKEIVHCSLSGGAPDYPVRPRTEGNYCLPNGSPMAPSYLGAIKETPRRMEQYMKHLLNILRRLDSASTHLDLCD